MLFGDLLQLAKILTILISQMMNSFEEFRKIAVTRTSTHRILESADSNAVCALK